MIRFWAYRIARIFLGVLVVSILTHLAIDHINIDPAGRLLETTETIYRDAEFKNKEYRRLERLLGYDEPSFYISVETLADNAEVNTDNRILYRVLYPYFPSGQTTLDFIENIPIEHRDRWNSVQSRTEIIQLTKTQNLAITPRIQKSQWRHYIPSFKWNGKNNRYHKWISDILNGDFGYSQASGLSVQRQVAQAIRWSAGISFIAYLGTFGLAIVLGVFLSQLKNRFTSSIIRYLLLLFHALPVFWLASLCIQYMTGIPRSGGLDLFVAVGRLDSCDSFWSCFYNNRYQLILPLLCLIIPNLAFAVEQVRKSFNQEYSNRSTHFLNSLGLSTQVIHYKYISRKALTPIITTMGLALPTILTGSIIIEIIFNIPGLGQLFFKSLANEDWIVIRTVVLLTVSLSILGFAISDFLYALLNPRLRQV